MASNNEILELAKAGKQLSEKAKDLVNLAGQFLNNNSAQAINWATVSDTNPTALSANGDFVGYEFTPAELSNVIGSLNTIKAFIVDNGHLGNFEKLAKPIV